MSEENKKTIDPKKNEKSHKKSTDTSKLKTEKSKASGKNVQKTGSKNDDWNDPTGNSHLGK